VLVVAGAAGGQQYDLFGPVPAWLQAIAILAGIALALAILGACITLPGGGWSALNLPGPVIALARAGLVLLAIAGIEAGAHAIPAFNRYMLGTVWLDGFLQGAIIGGGAALAGAATLAVIQEALGRTVHSEMASRLYTWLTASGFALVLVGFQLIAVVQGVVGGLGLTLEPQSPVLIPYWGLRAAGAACIFIAACLQGWGLLTMLQRRPGIATETPPMETSIGVPG
jgi:cbb3-type cytochrome oxidase subunit 1